MTIPLKAALTAAAIAALTFTGPALTATADTPPPQESAHLQSTLADDDAGDDDISPSDPLPDPTAPVDPIDPADPVDPTDPADPIDVEIPNVDLPGPDHNDLAVDTGMFPPGTGDPADTGSGTTGGRSGGGTGGPELARTGLNDASLIAAGAALLAAGFGAIGVGARLRGRGRHTATIR
ncbi:hypothetical protein ACIRCZ_18655 [Leifsonia sp. NPDC102414]|uniref:hypothetical protein n=1 Tax=Leifsonia sp. NPDC102414 TaxID=3364124 RepID=UPI0038279F91